MSGEAAPRSSAGSPAGREQRPVGEADGRDAEHGAELEREPGTARMVAAGGVDEQHVGKLLEPAHRRLEQRALAQGEHARLVPLGADGARDGDALRRSTAAAQPTSSGRPRPGSACEKHA